MKDLFYTEFDKNLFWIVGYDYLDNNQNVWLNIKYLIKYTLKFAWVAKCNPFKVKSFKNDLPPRYQHMRVFYIQKDYTEYTVPDKCYFIETVTEKIREQRNSPYSVEQLQWNMWKWITY